MIFAVILVMLLCVVIMTVLAVAADPRFQDDIARAQTELHNWRRDRDVQRFKQDTRATRRRLQRELRRELKDE